MPTNHHIQYEFGGFRLDTGQHILLFHGETIKLPQKSLELLQFFVENNDQVIAKEDLMKAIWPDLFVEDANLTVHISALRKLFAAKAKDSVRIETFPKVGYRFSANLNQTQLPKIQADGTLAKDFAPLDDTSEVYDDTRFGQSRKIGNRPVLIGLVVVVLLSVTIPFLAWAMGKISLVTARPELRSTQITALGSATRAAVSPDGKYLVYSREDDGQFELWLRVVGVTSETQILPPTSGFSSGLTFLPDGKSVAIGAGMKGENSPGIYILPIFGGSLTRLPLKRATSIDFSPDGTRLAYLYNNLPEGKTSLVVANADGSGEQSLITRQAPDYYWTVVRPVWSPDGKKIAMVGQNRNESFPHIFEFDLATGVERPITTQSWTSMRGIAWLPDMSGLLTVASEETSSVRQIWRIAYPDGTAESVTHDAISYSEISLSADGRTLVTPQRKIASTISIYPTAGAEPFQTDADVVKVDVEHGVKINESTVDGQDASEGLGRVTWAEGQRIVFSSDAGGNADIWSMNNDGTGRKQLTVDRRRDSSPSVSADGQTIAFVSSRTGGEHIWLMDSDGGNQRQITSRSIERVPAFSPDGNTLFYGSWDNGKGTVWRMPADGSEEGTQFISETSFRPVVSPDGTMLLYGTPTGFAVVNLADGNLSRNFVSKGISPQWIPTGNAFCYIALKNNVGNLWIQPLDERPARPLTDFSTVFLMSYDWSKDGKHIAIVTGRGSSDIILFTDLK